MNSCLYKCDVFHARSRPKQHAFNYRLFYFCLNLDQLDQLYRLPLVSKNGFNAYQLQSKDHLDFGKPSIKENVETYLQTQGYTEEIGKVLLVTQLRTFGHLFNPVSFYFIYDATDQPSCVVAEVANTFNEQKLYFIGPEKITNGHLEDEQGKFFYISPFSDLDTQLHFKIAFPKEKLRLQINQSDEHGTYFKSGVIGDKKKLHTRSLINNTLRFPLITLQIVVGIHWHALQLWMKKIPVRGKSKNHDQQREIRTYLTKSSNHLHQPLV